MVISFPFSISSVSFTCTTFGCLHSFSRFAPFRASSSVPRSFSLSLILHVNIVTHLAGFLRLPVERFPRSKWSRDGVGGFVQISCDSFGPDWKSDPIDPKYELVFSSLFREDDVNDDDHCCCARGMMMMLLLLLLLLCDVSIFLSLFRKGGFRARYPHCARSLKASFMSPLSKHFLPKEKKVSKNTAIKVHTPSRESDTERERERRRRHTHTEREREREMMGTL